MIDKEKILEINKSTRDEIADALLSLADMELTQYDKAALKATSFLLSRIEDEELINYLANELRDELNTLSCIEVGR